VNKQRQGIVEKLESLVNISMANTGRGRSSVERASGRNFRLGEEVRYIPGRAAEHDGRGIMFSAEPGDAWLLDRTGRPSTATFTSGTFAVSLWRPDRRHCIHINHRSGDYELIDVPVSGNSK
jgi:hypothetical protein